MKRQPVHYLNNDATAPCGFVIRPTSIALDAMVNSFPMVASNATSEVTCPTCKQRMK